MSHGARALCRASAHDLQTCAYGAGAARRLKARLPHYDYKRIWAGRCNWFIRGVDFTPGWALARDRPPQSLIWEHWTGCLPGPTRSAGATLLKRRRATGLEQAGQQAGRRSQRRFHSPLHKTLYNKPPCRIRTTLRALLGCLVGLGWLRALDGLRPLSVEREPECDARCCCAALVSPAWAMGMLVFECWAPPCEPEFALSLPRKKGRRRLSCRSQLLPADTGPTGQGPH